MGYFETFYGAMVPLPQGQRPYAYLIRTEEQQIAILDTRTPVDTFVTYSCHLFTGDAQDREQVKKLLRVRIYGNGVIAPDSPAVPADRTPSVPSGILTVTADGTRTDVYQYSPAAMGELGGELWVQGCLGLKWRTLDVTLQLKAKNIELREFSVEFTVIN